MTSKHIHLIQGSKLLFDALVDQKGLEHILEQGYRLLDNPIGMGDPSTKLIAHYKCIFEDQPLWNKQIEQGFFSREITSMPSFFELNAKVMKSSNPVIIENAYELPFRAITGKIRINNTILAFLSVFEYERPFKEEDVELAGLLCEAVSLEMQKTKSYKNIKGTAFEGFLTDLLDGIIRDENTIEERKDSLGLNLKEDLYVMVIDLKQSLLNIHTIYLISLLEDMVDSAKGIYYKEQVVMLISRSEGACAVADSNREKLETFLKNNQLNAGLSRCFHDLTEIETYFCQAQSAAELGQYRDGHRELHSFDQIALYYILKLCSSQTNLSDLCHPALLSLMEYDQKNNTDYTQTLYVLLSHQGNQTESADALCIHRATLIYRTAKIQELTLLNLKDFETINHLNISFMVLKLLGKLDFQCPFKE